jgi:hypothetical protein
MGCEQVAYPEQPEHERDDRADDERRNADHEPDEDAGDPDREADRPQARCRDVLGVALLFVHSLVPCLPCSGS